VSGSFEQLQRRKVYRVAIDVAELKKLGEQIFDSPDHPWPENSFN
jgi:hypothetical protein